MMEFFKSGSKSTAIVRSVALKKKRLSNGADSTFEKQVEFRVDVPITEAIKEGLDQRVVALIEAAVNGSADSTEETLSLDGISVKEEFDASVNFYGAGDFSKKSEPKVQLGVKSGAPAKVKMNKVMIKDGEPFLVLNIKHDYFRDLWLMLPNFFLSDMVISMVPLQGELDLDGKEADEEEPQETPEAEEIKDGDLIPGAEAVGKKPRKKRKAGISSAS